MGLGFWVRDGALPCFPRRGGASSLRSHMRKRAESYLEAQGDLVKNQKYVIQPYEL